MCVIYIYVAYKVQIAYITDKKVPAKEFGGTQYPRITEKWKLWKWSYLVVLP